MKRFLLFFLLVTSAVAQVSIPAARITGAFTAEQLDTLVPADAFSIDKIDGLQTALDAKLDDSQASTYGLDLLNDVNAAAARATLGLAIGTDVQAYDADLTAFAAKTAPAGAVVGTTDTQTLTNKTLTAPAITSPTGLVKGDVGLGNVDNTSDLAKPISTLTQAALKTKLREGGSLLVVGDSLSARYAPVSGNGNDWPSQLATLANWAGRVTITNLAVNSATAQNTALVIDDVVEDIVADRDQLIVAVWLGQNDFSTRSAVQIEADLTTIWSACRAAGAKVVAFKCPSVGNASAPVEAVKDAVNTWIDTQSANYDYVVDLSDLTETGTVDTIHYGAATNLTIAQRFDAAVGAYFVNQRSLAQTWHGSSTFRQQSIYDAAVVVDILPEAYDNEADTNQPYSTGIESKRAGKFFPFAFPSRVGLSVGDSVKTEATIANTLNLSGDFVVTAWLQLGARPFGSSSATGPLLGAASDDFLAINGSAGSGSASTVRPYARIDTVDITFTGVPFMQVERPTFVAWRRVSGLLEVCVDGIWSERVSNSNTITIDRAFHRTLAGAWLQARVYSMTIHSAGVSKRTIQNIMRGGAPTTTNLEAWWVFDDGVGTSVRDRSSNARTIDLSSASSYTWLTAAKTGSHITNTAAGNIAATTVQAALNELDTEKEKKALTATATLDFASIAAGASEDLTITVTGAAAGYSTSHGLPAAPAAGIVFNPFVSASNTVTIRATNVTGSAVDPASATYRATVLVP